jgi:hypothetical protein
MFDQARVQTLEMWTDRLREAGVESVVTLRYLAVAYADLGQIAEAENYLDRAHRAVTDESDPAVRALLENASALVATTGDYPGVLHHTGSASADGEDGGSRVRARLILRLWFGQHNWRIADAEQVAEEAWLAQAKIGLAADWPDEGRPAPGPGGYQPVRSGQCGGLPAGP